MKIVYIVPGFGGSFYCQNCIRNMDLAKTMIENGHDVVYAPMYLPLRKDIEMPGDIPVFYGAVLVYLTEKFPFLKRMPDFIKRMLNSRKLLNAVSKLSNSADPEGMEEMTISVMSGENGNQSAELDKLITWLKDIEKPDAVHFSNSLLVGIGEPVKKELGIPVFCTLQDEDTWIERMRKPYDKQAWVVLKEKSEFIDAFTSVSMYYKEKVMRVTGISEDKIKVIPLGIPLKQYQKTDISMNPPTLGFLSRMSAGLGLDILVKAFIILKKEKIKDLRLIATGGMTPADKRFINKMVKLLKKSGFQNDVEFLPDVYYTNPEEFFRKISVMTVPVPGGEAFGMYQIEAMASGRPVVQPETGAFPEIVNSTGGGIIYSPNTPEELARALYQLLTDTKKLNMLANKGYDAIVKKYSIETMMNNLISLYKSYKK